MYYFPIWRYSFLITDITGSYWLLVIYIKKHGTKNNLWKNMSSNNTESPCPHICSHEKQKKRPVAYLFTWKVTEKIGAVWKNEKKETEYQNKEMAWKNDGNTEKIEWGKTTDRKSKKAEWKNQIWSTMQNRATWEERKKLSREMYGLSKPDWRDRRSRVLWT